MNNSAKITLRLIWLLVFSACTSGDSQQPALGYADSLMQVRPDSALHYLESIRLQDLTSPAARAKYAVLFTQAQDKNYIRLTDDSLIQLAVHYYDSVGDVVMQAKAHYYLGRVYQDQKKKTEAVQKYWDVVPLAEKAKNGELLMLTMGNLGYLYMWEGLYDRADSLYLRAETLAVSQKDSTRLATFLLMRGRVLFGKEYGSVNEKRIGYLKAKCFLEQALDIAERIHNHRTGNSALVYLSALYEKMGNGADAIQMIRRGIAFQKDSLRHYGYFLALGNVFFRAEQYDSATYYYSLSLQSGNYYTKAGAAMQLSDIAKNKGDLKRALLWKDIHAKYLDTIRRSEHPIDMVTAEHKLHLRQRSAEYESWLEDYRYVFYALMSLLVGGVVWWWCIRVRHRRKVLALEEEKIRIQKNAMEQLAYIESKLECAKNALYLKNEEFEYIQDVVGGYEKNKREIALIEAEFDATCAKRQHVFLSQLVLTTAYQQLMSFLKEFQEERPEVVFAEKQLEELLAEIDRISFGFATHLKEKYAALNEEDIRFCCLVKAGLGYSDIGKVMSRITSTMYKRRDTVLEKMGENGKEVSFENLIVRV